MHKIYGKKIICRLLLILCTFIIQITLAKTINFTRDNFNSCRKIEEYIGINVPSQPKIYNYEYLKNGYIVRYYHLKPNFISKIQLNLFSPSSLYYQKDIFKDNLLQIHYPYCDKDMTKCFGGRKYEYDKKGNMTAFYDNCDKNLKNCKYHQLSSPLKNEETLYKTDKKLYKTCDAEKCEFDRNGNIIKKIKNNLVLKYTYKYDKYNNIVEVCGGKYGGCNKIKYECYK